MTIASISNAEAGSSIRTKLNSVIGVINAAYSASHILRAKEFGILPGNSGTTNDTGFVAMKAVMIADPDVVWRLLFDPGLYQYENNRWLYGVQSFILDAYGCTFENVTTDGWEKNSSPLHIADPFDDRGDAARTGANDSWVNGDLFDTAAAGDVTITLTTADPAGYGVGERVLVYGYDQQFGGYPPNMRYFEYKTVLSVDTGADTVTFTEPLAYLYDDRWWDTADYAGMGLAYGKPRILSLERTNYTHAKYIKILGANFLKNSQGPPGKALQTAADRVIYEDVQTYELYIATSHSVSLLRHRNYGVSIETDKLVGSVLTEDCDFSSSDQAMSLTGATGCNRLTVKNSRVWGRADLHARRIDFKGCDLYGPNLAFALALQGIITTSAGSFPISTLSAGDCTFHNLSQSPDLLVQCIDTGIVWTFTVGSVSGTDILLVWDATSKLVAQQLLVGHGITRSGNSGIVTAIYHDGGSPGNLVLEGTWTTPSVGHVFDVRKIESLVDQGGNVVVGDQVPIWRTPAWLTHP